MSYTRWWHSLLISFSVVTWGLAQPLYTIINSAAVDEDEMPAVLLVMLAWQVLPTVLLFLIDRAIIWRWDSGKALRIYRTGLFAIAALVFLRVLQLSYLSQIMSLPEAAKTGLVLALVGALICLGVFAFKTVTLLFVYLAAASVILTGVFAYQIMTRDTASGWSPEDEPLLAQDAPTPKTPIFIIIFDGLGGRVLLKDGQIDAERFPHFAALGRDSAVFTNATSNYNLTSLSIPSLLTGRWLKPEDLRVGPYPIPERYRNDSVLSVLMRQGYKIEEYDEGFPLLRSHPELFVPEIASTYYQIMVPRLLRQYFPLSPQSHAYSLSLWDDFLEGVSGSGSLGRVYFVHPLLPHEPSEFDRYGRRHPPPPPRDVAQMERAYEEQVMLVDNLLGKLTDKLKAEGLYDRSVIVVTGDHGPRPLGALLSHPPQDLSALSPSVTMIIHGPRVRPQVSEVDYQHIDFRPTFWEALGATRRRQDLPGVSAFAPDRPKRDKWYWNNWMASSGGSGALEESESLASFSGGWFIYNPTSGWWQLSPSGRPY